MPMGGSHIHFLLKQEPTGQMGNGKEGIFLSQLDKSTDSTSGRTSRIIIYCQHRNELEN